MTLKEDLQRRTIEAQMNMIKPRIKHEARIIQICKNGMFEAAARGQNFLDYECPKAFIGAVIDTYKELYSHSFTNDENKTLLRFKW